MVLEIQIEIAPEFFKEKFYLLGIHDDNKKNLCWYGFPTSNRLFEQEKCREIIESSLLSENYYIYADSSNQSKCAWKDNKTVQKLLKSCLKNENLETNDLEKFI